MQIETRDLVKTPTHQTRRSWVWMVDFLLVVIIILGAYFRFIGLNWDDNTHVHPDERFLTLVETGIAPVKSLAEYFNTATSSLNPYNRGFSFFVYGDLPVILVRYVSGWIGQTGYDQVFLVGRAFSGISDLLVVLLIYLIARRLYDRRVALLAAAFSAFAVLPIQLSHFFIVDNFADIFAFIATYFAVEILCRDGPLFPLASTNPANSSDDGQFDNTAQPTRFAQSWRALAPFLWFGIGLGLATGSKISAVFLAVILPMAVLVRLARMPREQQKTQWLPGAILLGIAAIVSLVAFRIAQPYAFVGPGFFNVKLNPQWIGNLEELRTQSMGLVDMPPALQWVGRPVWFAFQNMVEWGLGLPLGIAAWLSFLWMGWRILKGEWQKHLMLWAWTGAFFAYESLQWVSTMRYFMLIYPTLGLFAAWGIIRLWDNGAHVQQVVIGRVRQIPGKWLRTAGILAGVIVVGGTFAWAFAFTRIYTRTETRLAASQWIYQNVPGPIELQLQTPQGQINEPLPVHSGATVSIGQSYVIAFKPETSATLTQIELANVVATQTDAGQQTLALSIASDPAFATTIAAGSVSSDFTPPSGDPLGQDAVVSLDQPLPVNPQITYYLRINALQNTTPLALYGPVTLYLATSDTTLYQSLPPIVQTIQQGAHQSVAFTADHSGTLQSIQLPHAVDLSGAPGTKTLQVTVAGYPDPQLNTASGSVQSDFQPDVVSSNWTDPRGSGYQVRLNKPIQIVKGNSYVVNVSLAAGQGAVALYGAAPAYETEWDLALPTQYQGGFNPYDPYNTIWRGDLNLEMYWEDDPTAYQNPSQDKLNRFLKTLDQADYIFISSNRQWATITRVPQRYPLSTAFYRDLLGCPVNQDILSCYRNAEPGMYQGKLGFKLVAVFQSYPNIGPLQINDQSAEEAFTVYDHPKVFIFEKTSSYDPRQVRDLLSAVDTSHIIRGLPPIDYANVKELMMTTVESAIQQAGGTWSALFSTGALWNQFQAVGVVLWYLTIALLGLLAYPIVRLALPGLADRGYPLSRMAGMLLLAYIVWLGGSFYIRFTRINISIAVVLIAIVGGVLAYRQREDLRREWKEKRTYFLAVELIALVFFLIDLMIRYGNPDLWHPSKGGEKPMDFSFLNAVLKSTVFPPYDPWYAGGYINYYYYGYVIVGVVVKWLGIIPAVAYNLILPTLFSLVALGTFSLGWNLMAGHHMHELPSDGKDDGQPARRGWFRRLLDLFGQRQFQIGFAAVMGLLVLGNLGTVRMIWNGWQMLAAPGGNIQNVSVLQHWIWALEGLPKFLTGTPLPYYPSDWYWIPSRVIPELGNEITEFPMFTFLYADLHPHLMALPVTLFALAWSLSIVMGRARWGEPDGRNSRVSLVASFFMGAVAIGALYPTNTWDFPTYVTIACVALGYTLWRYRRMAQGGPKDLPAVVRRAALVVGSVLLLVGLSLLFYQPFFRWYGQAYNSLIPWTGDHTPFWSYLTMWGLFLFVIASWMAWETREWMAATPLSSLGKLRPYWPVIWGAAIVLLAAVVWLLLRGVQIAWLVLPMAAWAGVLILRPGQSDIKRFVLFLTGTALVLTLTVELIVLKGDIGRMNTVFKFYYQAWTMMAISAAGGLGWLAAAVWRHRPTLRISWQAALTCLVVGAALFPVTAGMEKIRDRMAPNAPHTLNGMTYMLYSQYTDGPAGGQAKTMNLNQDYWAIQWMQEHVKGSPVIVEANTPEYRWGNRFTIYTGLPGVVGWAWHEEQQRALLPSTWVTDRIAAIQSFYDTTDPSAAMEFLRTYNVKYIIVGQLEEIYYSPVGLAKFPKYNGVLWKEVYHQGDTSIYEVIPGAIVPSVAQK
ncbi:MAG: DUF2298 domain-containing protein [Chloroflexi bacterium]|nr:DUF2298 domain-containing protein [Chloroflexota bacterium]